MSKFGNETVEPTEIATSVREELAAALLDHAALGRARLPLAARGLERDRGRTPRPPCRRSGACPVRLPICRRRRDLRGLVLVLGVADARVGCGGRRRIDLLRRAWSRAAARPRGTPARATRAPRRRPAARPWRTAARRGSCCRCRASPPALSSWSAASRNSCARSVTGASLRGQGRARRGRRRHDRRRRGGRGLADLGAGGRLLHRRRAREQGGQHGHPGQRDRELHQPQIVRARARPSAQFEPISGVAAARVTTYQCDSVPPFLGAPHHGVRSVFQREVAAEDDREATNKLAQQPDRWGALEKLKEDGSEEALFGLCKRFGVTSMKGVEDEQEKHWVVETLVASGAPALGPLVTLHEVGRPALVPAARARADRGSRQGARDRRRAVRERAARLRPHARAPDRPDPVVQRVEGRHRRRGRVRGSRRTSTDFDENVRFAAIEGMAGRDPEKIAPPLIAALLRPEEESGRIKRTIVEVLARRRRRSAATSRRSLACCPGSRWARSATTSSSTPGSSSSARQR